MASYDIDTASSFQLAIEASPNGVLVVEPGGTIVFVNRELERQFGYTREELIGQCVDLLVPESQRELQTIERMNFARASEPWLMGAGRDLFGLRKDGTKIPVEIRLNPIHLAEGLCVLMSVVDITERRRFEDGYRAAFEERLAFERLVADLSGRFINLSQNQMDDAIHGGLRRICQDLDLDRGTFLRIGSEGVVVHAETWSGLHVPLMPASAFGKHSSPWKIARVLAGDVVSFFTLDEIPSEIDRHTYRESSTMSGLVFPLSVAGLVAGAVEFHAVRRERVWSTEMVHRLQVISSVFCQVLARQQREEALRGALAEVERLKDELQVENLHLRQEVRESLGSTSIVGHSAGVRQVLEQILQVGATDSTVLLVGETGTGKELFAAQIHEQSARRNRAMVRVNCAAIPATLIESELFGREKGAFTGALARQIGRFELAHHSTIFLDEIGDLPPEVQVKLLRVLEEREIERLGSPRPIPIDTRIVAATHRNLEQRVAEGLFREDLFYRLNVFPIRVPPLRERREDIPLLVWRFVEEFSKAFGKHVDTIGKENLAALQQYAWPGNIRELRNVVERAMIGATGPRLTISLPQASVASMRRSAKLLDVEKEHIRGVLESTGWRIRGVGGAADRLGMKPTTLETRMAKLGLKRPGHD